MERLTDFDRMVLALHRDRISEDPLTDRAVLRALDKIGWQRSVTCECSSQPHAGFCPAREQTP